MPPDSTLSTAHDQDRDLALVETLLLEFRRLCAAVEVHAKRGLPILPEASVALAEVERLFISLSTDKVMLLH